MNIRPFQIFLIGLFGFMGLVTLFVLNQYQGTINEEDYPFGTSVVIWGTIEENIFNAFMRDVAENQVGLHVVSYVEIDPRNFENELVNRIAEGESPDLIIIDATQIVGLRTKLQPIPYTSLPVRDYRDQFIDAADIFMLQDGIYALPFAMDPLVMYWNRDLFGTNGLPQPPQTWETVVSTVVPTLTKRDTRRTILQSAISFGEYRNVQNAKSILLTLMLQSGSQMVRERGDEYSVLLNNSTSDDRTSPLTTSLQFYADFSNPNSPLYSWNRSQPLDQNAFVAGDLATYFGFGSEQSTIQDRNPNLNFDAVVVPQGSNATVRRTYADVYGFAIPRAAENLQGAFGVAQVLSRPENASMLARQLELTPVHRSLLGEGGVGPFERINYESALFARSWLDPDAEASDDIFSVMVEDVVSNRSRANGAASDAIGRLELNFE